MHLKLMIFSKIILTLILKGKRTLPYLPVNSIFLILLSGNFALESHLESEPLLGGWTIGERGVLGVPL